MHIPWNQKYECFGVTKQLQVTVNPCLLLSRNTMIQVSQQTTKFTKSTNPYISGLQFYKIIICYVRHFTASLAAASWSQHLSKKKTKFGA